MSDTYQPPTYDGTPAVTLSVTFDHGDTGLPLLDTSQHLSDLVQSVYLGLLYAHWRGISSLSDITYERTTALANQEIRQVDVRRISLNSPLDIVMAAPATIVACGEAFAMLERFYYRLRQDRTTRQSIDDDTDRVQRSMMDEILEFPNMTKKQRKETEARHAALVRLLKGVQRISIGTE